MGSRLRTLLLGHGNQIGRRLIVFIIAFSSLVTLFISAFQLVAEYRGLRSALDQQLEGVRIYVPSISGSVWDFDRLQVQRALDALILLPNVTQVAVKTSDTHSDWRSGKNLSDNVVTKTYSLRHDMRGVDTEIGVLTVVASLDGIDRQVIDSAVSIVLSNGLKTFLVALFMVYVIRRLITSRLETMARKVHGLIPGMRSLRQVVEAEPHPIPASLDELDAVDWTLDKTAEDLRIAVAALTDLNAELEERVEERTEELQIANAALVDTVEQLERTQRELVQQEKLAALGYLVAGIAHELNTPIGNALTVATTLEADASDLQTTLGVRALRRSEFDTFIEHSVSGAKMLTANLHRAAQLIIDFKEVAVDRTSERRRVFDLRRVVDEVLSTLRPQYKNKFGRVSNDIPSGITMDSFPGPLGQVVANLLMNALIHGLGEHGEQGQGDVRISAVAGPEKAVCVLIRDNGKGIPAEDLGRIFDPFFTTRLGQGGSGLGLSIVHNIVTTTLGGRVSVTSQVGVGTVFQLDLPLSAPTAPLP